MSYLRNKLHGWIYGSLFTITANIILLAEAIVFTACYRIAIQVLAIIPGIQRSRVYFFRFLQVSLKKLIPQKDWGFHVKYNLNNSKVRKVRFCKHTKVYIENPEIGIILDNHLIDNWTLTKGIQLILYNLIYC